MDRAPLDEPELCDFCDLATGEYNWIAYLDACDAFDEERRQTQAKRAKTYPFRPRVTRPRKDYKTCHWWTEYVVDEARKYDDPVSRDGKLFRKRFALSKEHVWELADRMNRENVWVERKSAFHQEPVPLKLLLLGALRILARNWTLDDVHEQLFFSERTMKRFFCVFVGWYGTVVFDEVIKMPTLEELTRNGAEYGTAGVPGPVGSVDCVHVRQWCVSANLRQMATGKEKYPSRSYEVMVNHRGRILSVTTGFHGSVNDKTIVKFDGAMTSIRDGLYADHSFLIYDSDGNLVEMKGAYVICDNGYLKWPSMMEPSKYSCTIEEKMWSEMIESLRKDVECTFGVRRACLRPGFRCQVRPKPVERPPPPPDLLRRR